MRKSLKQDLDKLIEELGQVAVKTARNIEKTRLPYLTGALRNSIRVENKDVSDKKGKLDLVYGGVVVTDDSGGVTDVDYAGALEFAIGRNKRHKGFVKDKAIPEIKNALDEVIRKYRL